MTDTVKIGTIMVQDSVPMPNSLIGAQPYSRGWSVVIDPRHRASSEMARHMNTRFDLRNACESVAREQDAKDRINTQAALVPSEDKRGGVAEDGAGYLIHEWQALRDQARRMII